MNTLSAIAQAYIALSLITTALWLLVGHARRRIRAEREATRFREAADEAWRRLEEEPAKPRFEEETDALGQTWIYTN